MVSNSTPYIVSSFQHNERNAGDLDLRLLIGTRDQCLVRWVQIQTDDVSDLLDEHRVLGELKGFRWGRLESKGAPMRLTALWLKPLRFAMDRVGEHNRDLFQRIDDSALQGLLSRYTPPP